MLAQMLYLLLALIGIGASVVVLMVGIAYLLDRKPW